MNKFAVGFTVAAAACHAASADLDVTMVDVEDLLGYSELQDGDVKLAPWADNATQGMIEVDFSSRSPKGEALCPSGWKVGYPSFATMNIGEYYFGDDCVQMTYTYDSNHFSSNSEYHRTCAYDTTRTSTTASSAGVCPGESVFWRFPEETSDISDACTKRDGGECWDEATEECIPGHGDSAFLAAHSQWYADADVNGSLPLEECFKRAQALGAEAVSVANEYLNASDVLIPGNRCYFYTGQYVGPVPAAAKESNPWKFTVDDLTHSWKGTHKRQQEDNYDSLLYSDKNYDDDRVQWKSTENRNEQFWVTCLLPPAYNDRDGCCREYNGKKFRNLVGTTTVTIAERSYAAATKACKEECDDRSTCTAVETRRNQKKKFVCEFHTAAGINAITRKSKSCRKATCSVKV